MLFRSDEVITLHLVSQVVEWIAGSQILSELDLPVKVELNMQNLLSIPSFLPSFLVLLSADTCDSVSADCSLLLLLLVLFGISGSVLRTEDKAYPNDGELTWQNIT